ncbi:DNA polymerase Y family protein [Schaalia sp. 19OD2882]|uniref:Y-family DNA polymerase n=1 Tax=Schaalia sp. 19OD2882 TaxID=2794089 RepID=UPI001C1EAA6A|nr:DNA polymerase Y family protein [Schaalia sp. 19OD2882]QWW18736.1 DNA polymerase Y family protein [Schaalia sp. 19OD2882]
MRRVVLWVPEWPVSALAVDAPPGAPTVLAEGPRVLLASTAARRHGVRSRMPLSTARHLCPRLLVLPRDDDREGRAFEVVLEAFDSLAAHVVCLRPGLAWAPSRGPVRWAGSEEALAEELIDAVAAACGAEAQVGIATGALTALAAARRGVIVPKETHREFLDTVPLPEALPLLPAPRQDETQELLDSLEVLGVRTCGDLRALGARAFLTRFGGPAEHLWALAAGGEVPVVTSGRVPGDLRTEIDLDPPAVRVEDALLHLRAGAVDLAAHLHRSGVGSHRLTACARTETGQERQRVWQGVDARDVDRVVERLRWLVRGWSDLVGTGDEGAPSGGLVHMVLIAGELDPRPDQQALWGRGEAERRLERSATRICSLLGDEGLCQPIRQGGHDPRTRILMRPWGHDVPGVPRDGEWDGGLEDAPSTVFEAPVPVDLLGATTAGGWEPVRIDERGRVHPPPGLMRMPARTLPDPFRQESRANVAQVHEPWLVLGRWWEDRNSARGPRAYLRLALTGTSTRSCPAPDMLLVQRAGQWFLEGLYD